MIKFRPFIQTDLPYRVKWLNNPALNRFIGQLGVRTNLSRETKWFSNYQKDPTRRLFVICDRQHPIGLVGLIHINRSDRQAELFIAIGEDDYRGQGWGKQALQWIIRYAFLKLKLHKIKLSVTSDNTAAIHLYEAMGFGVEGELSDEIFDRQHQNYRHLKLMALFNPPRHLPF